MKKVSLAIAILAVVILFVTAFLIKEKDIQTKDKIDLSKISFKLKIQDAFMIGDFGLKLTGKAKDGDVGIVLYGKVEKGKVKENSKVIFVEENGEVLQRAAVFKIEIVAFSDSSSFSKRQSFAKAGDDVALYFKGDENLLELIRKGLFVIKE